MVVIRYRIQGQWKAEVVKPDFSGVVNVVQIANRLATNGAMAITWADEHEQ